MVRRSVLGCPDDQMDSSFRRFHCKGQARFRSCWHASDVGDVRINEVCSRPPNSSLPAGNARSADAYSLAGSMEGTTHRGAPHCSVAKIVETCEST